MVAEISAEVAQTSAFLGKDKLDPRVIAAMGRVPRHAFVPEAERWFAYENRPLPIGHGQTISQPYMVAVMADLAGVGPEDIVLEVGTGCGYQAAVLAELAARVETIERVPALAEAAAARLKALGYDNIEVRAGDGAEGWPAARQYDAIVVTAAAQGEIPQALVDQLASGGRLVIPVERRSQGGAGKGFDLRLRWFGPEQDLLLVTKDETGELKEVQVLPVAFVPLVRNGEDRPKKAE